MKRFLFMALVAGCAHESPLHVELPHSPHAGGFGIDHDAYPRRRVSVSQDGTVWLGGARISTANLQAELNAVQQAGDFRIELRADRHAPFSRLRPVMDICSRFSPQLYLTVWRQKPDVETGIDVYGELPGGAPPFITITLSNGQLALNRREMQPEQLKSILDRLASLDPTIPVVIVPGATHTVQDVVDLMDLCLQARLLNLHLVEKTPIVEEINERMKNGEGPPRPDTIPVARPSVRSRGHRRG